MTGGMDNPVDVAFTPGGERILDRHVCRASAAAAGATGSFTPIYGGVYGKVARRDRRPPAHRRSDADDDAARARRPCGLHALRVDGVRRRIIATTSSPRCSTCARSRGTCSSRAARRSRSATPISSSRTTATSIPTDVLEDADGSLLVRRHRRLVQALLPDVAAGQAGRARRDLPRPPRRARRSARPARPHARVDDDGRCRARGAADGRADGGAEPGVRELRDAEARARSPVLSDVLRTSPSVGARRNAVWALDTHRWTRARARALARVALTDRDESVRQAAIHAAGLLRDAARARSSRAR